MDNLFTIFPKKISFLFLSLIHLTPGFGQNPQNFTILFDGKNLDHWEMYGDNSGFEIKEGIIQTTVQNGDNLFTKKTFGNYTLQLEYFLSEVGNSGVLIRCDPKDAWTSGVEVQLLAPWTPYRDDLHCTASLYGHVAVTDRPDETTGVWHEMEIHCDRKYIRISVDGKTATEVNIDTVESMQDKFLEGAIGLQSNHGKPSEFAHFRNIRILNLDDDPEYVLKGFRDEDGRVREQAYNAAVRHGHVLVADLLIFLSSDDPVLLRGAQQVLFDLVADATDPARNHLKNQLKRELRKYRKNAKTKMAKEFTNNLLRLM